MIKLRNFWLYVGIFLVCSGIGTAAGIVILALYFWQDIRNAIDAKNPYTVHFYDDSDSNDESIGHGPQNHYSNKVRDEMK